MNPDHEPADETDRDDPPPTDGRDAPTDASASVPRPGEEEADALGDFA